MAYNEKLATRIREHLASIKKVEEREMMGGLTFMVNRKMCVGIIKDELMCRINPEEQEACLERNGCRTMDFTKRPMKGFIMIEDSAMKSKKDFDYWINLSLDYNKIAKASKKKKKKT